MGVLRICDEKGVLRIYVGDLRECVGVLRGCDRCFFKEPKKIALTLLTLCCVIRKALGLLTELSY